jgi:proton glutamate symport protein
VVLGVALAPGSGLSLSDQALLGGQVTKAEGTVPAPMAPGTAPSGLLGLLRSMIPENIFAAASGGSSLALVFFSILLGLGLGSLRSARGAAALDVVEAGYEALLRILGWVMYGLPIGLVCLVADRVSASGAKLFLAMGGFVVALYVGVAVLMLLSALAIWRRRGGTLIASLAAVKAPLLVAAGTSSNFAAMPSALKAVTAGLRRDPEGVKLVVPMGTNLYLQGSVLYFTLAAFFVAQLFEVPLGWEQYAVIVVAGIFAAVAASDAPGLAGIGMIAIVLDPLGLPAAVAIVLLSSVDPLLEPAITLADVYGNCAAAAVVVEPATAAQDPGAGNV